MDPLGGLGFRFQQVQFKVQGEGRPSRRPSLLLMLQFLPHPKWGFPRIRGTILGGPNNKDCNILGSILVSPYFGKLPNTSPFGNYGILVFYAP